jgi:hypothetical protein
LFGYFPWFPAFGGDPELRQTIVGKPKIEQTLERFGITKEGAMLHGGAPLAQGFDGAIQPDRGPACLTYQLQVELVRESPASQGDHCRLSFQDLDQSRAFELAEEWLARSFKYLAYTQALSGLDNGIEVDERPSQFPGKKFTDSGFATAHEPQEIDLFASVPAHSLEMGGVEESRS